MVVISAAYSLTHTAQLREKIRGKMRVRRDRKSQLKYCGWQQVLEGAPSETSGRRPGFEAAMKV